jgi:hypothetical protein
MVRYAVCFVCAMPYNDETLWCGMLPLHPIIQFLDFDFDRIAITSTHYHCTVCVRVHSYIALHCNSLRVLSTSAIMSAPISTPVT